MMPPTSPWIAQELFDTLLFTPFHENVTIYPDDIFVASPRQENFQPPMTTNTPAATYVSVLSAGRPLTAEPVCYDRASWTIIFFSIPSPLRRTTDPFLYLVDYAPPLLSITRLTLAFTVPHTCASVPADEHPLCTVRARFSSLLPYVSLHPLCMPPYPLTCVVARPLYAP